jgi:hypothetical protein
MKYLYAIGLAMGYDVAIVEQSQVIPAWSGQLNSV